MFDLQDKLIRKEYLNAKLYYNLGSYFGNCTNGGNNYEACIITAQNALNDYPYSNLREDFAILVMKSKFELAQMSVESKSYNAIRMQKMNVMVLSMSILTLNNVRLLKNTLRNVRSLQKDKIEITD